MIHLIFKVVKLISFKFYYDVLISSSYSLYKLLTFILFLSFSSLILAIMISSLFKYPLTIKKELNFYLENNNIVSEVYNINNYNNYSDKNYVNKDFISLDNIVKNEYSITVELNVLRYKTNPNSISTQLELLSYSNEFLNYSIKKVSLIKQELTLFKLWFDDIFYFIPRAFGYYNSYIMNINYTNKFSNNKFNLYKIKYIINNNNLAIDKLSIKLTPNLTWIQYFCSCTYYLLIFTTFCIFFNIQFLYFFKKTFDLPNENKKKVKNVDNLNKEEFNELKKLKLEYNRIKQKNNT